jgi:hypothetical protein
MLLAVYLNDHLAGATAGLELARRASANNRGTALGEPLERLTGEIDEDREALLALMSSLSVRVDRVKVLGGWGAEKLGRLKPNGRLLSYSPLSRLLELEGLLLAVQGKLALWQTLKELEGRQPPLARAGLARLLERAERQLTELQSQHRAIVAGSLATEIC